MRQTLAPQLQLGEVDIGCIEFDLQSRDDIPQLLRGLQHIYMTPAIRDAVFPYLEQMIRPEVNTETGRPGMELWDILVLGTLRVNLNCDYDRVGSELVVKRPPATGIAHGSESASGSFAARLAKSRRPH